MAKKYTVELEYAEIELLINDLKLAGSTRRTGRSLIDALKLPPAIHDRVQPLSVEDREIQLIAKLLQVVER